jgi:thiol-disulfide isomerase/thioredoxin
MMIDRSLALFARRAVLLALALAVALAPRAAAQPKDSFQLKPGTIPPELEGGAAWYNTGAPLKLKDLRGKVVLLDFWTLCCINCMHIMPDLAKLEEKYKNQLVVIGIHSGKFENEHNGESIRKAILRYELKHPVVNDAEMKIWNAYGAAWWPTIVIIDPEGKLVGGRAGEVNFNAKEIDQTIANVIAAHRKKKTLDETPLRFDTAKFRDRDDTPLYFPGKVVADEPGKRLFIADSTHHRVVITDLNGKKIDIAGAGHPGNKDGTFERAQFDDPQGMAVRGDVAYVADRKNNTVRRLDLKARTVTTVAGTGHQGKNPVAGPATERALNSPWDLWLDGNRLFIAMAGHHQIWTLNLRERTVVPFAGKGQEDLVDGPLHAAIFAQPSGLTSDGKHLYVADAEASAIRRVPQDGKGGRVETLVGRGLFEFGDRDGPGQVADPNARKTTEAMLQHPVGVAYHDGRLYVADTYNSKIKVIEPATGLVSTLEIVRPKDEAGPLFNEPTGLSAAGGNLYVADTNAHRIRVVELHTRKISTLELKDVPPVEAPKK